MKKFILLVALLLTIPTMGHALLLTSSTGGTSTVLDTVTGTWTSSPSVVAGGFTVSAPVGSEVWYGDSSFNLLDNGNWQDFSWVGGYCYSGDCTATIDLGGLYSSVGGFMNYAMSNGSPEVGSEGSGSNPTISAIAADGTTILEQYDLFTDAPILTLGGLNDGAFRGISRATADIAFFRLSGSYLIMHDITLEHSKVPESSALLLLGSGIIALSFMRRRLKS